MKTTLNIDDKVMADLKREAARQGRTMSELVESALRLSLRSQSRRQKIVALPTFRSSGALVDIADRDACTRPWKGANARRMDERPRWLKRCLRIARVAWRVSAARPQTSQL
jgi:plasmid stability protein